jgi:glycosyltransferase involved in cell wall biosynthesis
VTIDICIPTYNQARYVAGAVRGALAQVGVEPQVWVSDDASTDETAKVLEAFGGLTNTHCHRHARNGGIAFNAGWVMAQAGSEFIVRLDSDDVLHPDYCEKLAGLLAAHPKAGVAHCAVREIDAEGRGGRVRRLARKTGFQLAEEALRQAKDGYRVAANVCMFRKKALDSLSCVYPEGLNFAEDWDLFARLADAGWGNVYSAGVLADYRVWADQGGVREKRKAAEIAGIRHVLGKTLATAWQRRGWNAEQLDEACWRFAVAQAESLLALGPDSEEFRRLRALLLELAPGKEEELDRRLAELRRGSWWHSTEKRIRLRLRDLAKAVMYRG